MGEGARTKNQSRRDSKGKTKAGFQGDTTFMPDFKFLEGRHRVCLGYPVHLAHRTFSRNTCWMDIVLNTSSEYLIYIFHLRQYICSQILVSSSHRLVIMVRIAEIMDILRQDFHMQENKFGEESPPVDKCLFSFSSQNVEENVSTQGRQ